MNCNILVNQVQHGLNQGAYMRLRIWHVIVIQLVEEANAFFLKTFKTHFHLLIPPSSQTFITLRGHPIFSFFF
jgi:hypothetical protein